MKKYPNIYVGPMSKNIVDCCIEFNNGENKVGFIPSRRQIDKNGGYVNKWTTRLFKQDCDNIIIKRDHAGPGQGQVEDDGFESLEEDCKYFSMIHIDPWKKYSSYNDGLQWTIKMLNFCYEQNPAIEYEIGTEESIRKFTVNEVDRFIIDLKRNIDINVYNQIRYIVIQSGTSLQGNVNTGTYDKNRLSEMVTIAKKHNLFSKEHNGDYIDHEVIKEKMSIGLDSINIAPEFGLIETDCYLESDINLDVFWDICFKSRRWEKWVNKSFNPYKQKKELIRICGHYVFSEPNFLSIKPNIDDYIKLKINEKLNELYK